MTILDAHDPASFRAAGHRLVDGLADYLETAASRQGPVLPPTSPDDLLAEAPSGLAGEPQGDLVDELLEVVRRSNHLHHPGFVGHQISVPLPGGALVEMALALLNNGMAIYEMGPLHAVLERHVVRFLADRLGFPAEADGVLTHGGSLGNLTALLAARQARSEHDVWTEGQSMPLAVLVSEQAHYSIRRSVQCMGWGAEGAVPVATDDRFRLRPDALPAALDQARRAGRHVVAVVASSCSTATGSFDPLPAIADFCESEGLWLHVDGAHGASLALSRRHRDRLDGIDRADSVTWDLHKMMGLPALSTAVLYRDGRRAREAFAQEASYLFDREAPGGDWFDIGPRTFECTKRGMGVTAYLLLRTLGTEAFGEQVDRLLDRARELAELLDAQDDFEIATEPEANILCFRHLAADVADLDDHQDRIRSEVLSGAEFYLVRTELLGKTWLRTTLMNPMTTRDDLLRLVAEIRRASQRAALPSASADD
ncbi:MAG: aminotransferase class I/II-fold pyridoxal phosphate-dependent enzyme [Acidobacteriota bacterium]